MTSPDEKESSKASPKEKQPKQVVYSLSRASRCYRCDRKLALGELVKLEKSEEDREALCQKCSGLEGLTLIAKGNAKITRLASKYSSRSFVVMKWSEVWKTYERLGILAEPEAVARAEAESGEVLKKTV